MPESDPELAALDPDLERAIRERAADIPIFRTLGFHALQLGAGTCSARISRDPRYDGIFESLHGGILITLADSAAALAILTLCGADARIATTDMSIRFLAPARSDVRVHARVIKAGKSLVPVEATLHDEEGVLVAVSQVSYFRLDAR